MNGYFVNNLSNFQDDTRKTWKFLNETLGRSTKKHITLHDSNGNDILSDSIKADLFNNHFLNSIRDLKSKILVYPSDNCNMLRTLSQFNTRFVFNHTTYDEIQKEVLNLSVTKSCGHDDISPKVINACHTNITPHLHAIFNSIVTTKIYPEVLKIHKVIPIPKEKNANTIDRYRPISVLPVINNIFERILHRQINAHFEGNHLLSKFQYGFRKGCGTEEATINIQNHICKMLDMGYRGVTGIFFDLTKAFDMIDHKILIRKLQYYGIDGPDLVLLQSYLQSRKQFVQINGSKSEIRHIIHGVPQGSVLGPLLFAIYINDLENLNFTGQLFMYADDICLFYPYKYEEGVKPYIERDAALLFEYMRINKLFINQAKTKLICFKPHCTSNSNFGIYVDGELIPEVNSVKYLGLQFQSNLAWDQHIMFLKSKISPVIGILYKFKNKFNRETKLLIYQTLIQSHINYLALIYGYKRSSELKMLQRLQNRALKTVANLPMTHSTKSLYSEIFPNILPIHGTYKLQIISYVFKCLNGIGHHTIGFMQNQNVFSTRNQLQLRVALCRTETTKQRIEHAGSKEFNNLPRHIKECTNIFHFKKMLKQYLLSNIDDILNH